MISDEQIAEWFPHPEQTTYVRCVRDRFHASYNRFKELRERDPKASEAILNKGREKLREMGITCI